MDKLPAGLKGEHYIPGDMPDNTMRLLCKEKAHSENTVLTFKFKPVYLNPSQRRYSLQPLGHLITWAPRDYPTHIGTAQYAT